MQRDVAVEDQIVSRADQDRAFLVSAAQDAIDAVSLADFMEKMNRVVRCCCGKLPDDIHYAWDRIVQKNPSDRVTITAWLETIVGPRDDVTALDPIQTISDLANGTTPEAQTLSENDRETDLVV